ncbi:MAG: hypothetical protein ABIK28_07355 [Planctomycetota bacterium]
MSRMLMFLLLGGLVFTAFSGTPLAAQNLVENSLFATGDLTCWTTEDSTPIVVVGNTTIGMSYYCCRKNPGAPNDNGSIEQEVLLNGGTTYVFSADISAKYCST